MKKHKALKIIIAILLVLLILGCIGAFAFYKYFTVPVGKYPDKARAAEFVKLSEQYSDGQFHNADDVGSAAGAVNMNGFKKPEKLIPAEKIDALEPAEKDELNIGWRDRVGDLDYNVSANLSTVRNKVLRMGEAFNLRPYTRTEVGRSISDFYLIPFDGIFQSMDEVYNHTATLDDGTVKIIQPDAKPGDVRYVDVNGDGQIDTNDRTWCGSPLPKFELGLNVSLNWHNFDFNMFWAGKFGNKIYNQLRKNLLNFNVDNIPADVSPWTWDNPSSEYPRMLAGTTSNNIEYCDRFLESGTYFRLKNIQLGYTLPAKLSQKIFVQKLRVYVSGTNLVTLTGYKGYDPDIISTDVYQQGIDGGQYPSCRQMNFGLQVTF